MNLWSRGLLGIVLCALGAQSFTWDETTPLDDYVNYDDGFFYWEELLQYRFEANKTTVYMLNMTSQKWLDESFSSRSVWYHMMAVAIPDRLLHQVAFEWIEGGSNDEGTGPAPPDDELVLMTVEVAERTGCVCAYVRQVPNSPVTFTNDPEQRARTEDAIIAWTWHTFITTHMDQPEVILRMPMTKAAKRGFDAIRELVQQKVPGSDINSFVPGGGSKRGWTTWSVAATDRRVIAACPVVMSLLNFNDTLQSHFRNLGEGWSFAFKDYFEVNLTARIHDDIVLKSPGGLWDYEDMFRYRERLGLIPKLLVSAAGDEFFILTDSHNWWNEMPGDKWLEMVPNAEHSLVPWYRKVAETIASFVTCVVEKIAMPTVSWFRKETPEGGLIRFSTNVEPDSIAAWQAWTTLLDNETRYENDTRKDFRLAVGYPPFIHPVLWQKVPFQDLGYGHYLVEFERPETGFTGVFFEAQWNYVTDMTMTLTSEVHVSPDTFPGNPCYADACYGYLT